MEKKSKRVGISNITIENFKGIEKPVEVPLRPITLLFGANSVGKSTILQAMHYGREILENRNPNADRTILGGDIIDLGGFRRLVHLHDESRHIKIKFDLNVNDDGLPPFSNLTGPTRSGEKGAERDILSDYIDIQRVSVELEIGILEGKVQILGYHVGLNGEPIGSITLEHGYPYISKIELKHPLFYSSDPENNLSVHKEFERFLDLMGVVDSKDRNIKPIPLKGYDSVIPNLNEPFRIQEDANLLNPDIEEFWIILSQIFIRPGQLLLKQLQKLRYLGPTRDLPPRNYMPQLTANDSRWVSGLGAWDLLTKEYPAIYNEWNTEPLVSRCNYYLLDVLKMGYSLKKERKILLEENGGVMKELQLLSNIYEEKDVDYFNEKVFRPLKLLPQITTLKLHDIKNNIDVDPHDVGVGISQSLPVIVGTVDQGSSVFAVEQPELHVHPAVQCNMGDLFIQEAIKEGVFDRTFLLETHSEHLVLRIMRRIRETAEKKLPENFPEVTPDLISILFVENIDGKSIIREMPLNENGEFIKAWPGGFFEEGLRETL